MKIKVDLSCVIDLREDFDLYPTDEIEANMINSDELWDFIGEGCRVSNRNCVVRILEEHSDD